MYCVVKVKHHLYSCGYISPFIALACWIYPIHSPHLDDDYDDDDDNDNADDDKDDND